MANTPKYTLIERERKFLLAPDDQLIQNLPFKIITDHYIEGTQLRFRKVTDERGSVYKLTRKEPANTPGECVITTIYITAREYKILNIHQSVSVEKHRFLMESAGLTIGIDKYLKGDDELWLAEIEFETSEQMQQFTMPINYTREVTRDENFNGYQLAKRFSKIE